MAGEVVVETKDLTKKYGEFTAVSRLSLHVNEGEIFGLLGPNGAGKTTTILMLLGLTEPTAGAARVYGFNPTREPLKVKRIVGYLPDNIGFYDDLSAMGNLRYTSRLNGIKDSVAEKRIKELLDLVGIADVANKKVGTYSRGMRQRLGIADVLLKEPKLVVLDEPTLGIDPEGVERILEIIERLSREQNITIILSSHLLHQVQRVCHRVGIFVRGQMVEEGTVDQLGEEEASRTGRGVVIEFQASQMNATVQSSLQQVPGLQRVEPYDGVLLAHCDRDARVEIGQAIASSGAHLLHLKLHRPGLEEIYLKYFHEA